MRFKLTPRFVLFAVLCVCPTSGEFWLRHGHAAQKPQIVFSSTRDGNSEIYTMDSDGGNQKRLTTNQAEDAKPAWSPDGQHIAFVSDRGDGRYQIYVINAEGGRAKKLTDTQDNRDPSWSPDGQKIAFTSRNVGRRARIAVMDVDGHNAFKLTDGRSPAWSPDGQRLAFEFHDDEGHLQIYVINVNGQESKKVTHDLENKFEPVWSPNGQQIAYYSFHGGIFQIYTVDVDGENRVRLTHNQEHHWYPAWSPDGRTIAYNISNVNGIGRSTIHLMSADGKYLNQLSDLHNGSDFHPDFGTVTLAVSPPSNKVTIWGRLKKLAPNLR